MKAIYSAPVAEITYFNVAVLTEDTSKNPEIGLPEDEW